MTSHPPARAVVRCLGNVSLMGRGSPVRRWRAGKARDLFLYLLVNRGRPVDRDELHGALWPDRERSPREQQDWLRSLALGAADYLLQDAVCRDDLLLVTGTPAYHGGMSGLVKNALDSYSMCPSHALDGAG
ncbi:hypothetical protein [Streptomyces sp. NBC_00829]|uniref:hypothetical protein n=1 Tax=Streptomyces sp. NBC_00829 TaxID=2903679 RepID=UPI00386EE4D4|nr:hypothetical protein OG293_01815 [Streptomyces sp. NBC_00829]